MYSKFLPLALAGVVSAVLPVGQVITSCTVPGVVALTFDDGAFAYTAQALDTLDAAGFKATFFINGENWGSINDYASVIQRMKSSGHQIGSHTWSHADLATLDAAGVTSQMVQLENALLNIIGVYTTYMRPPYLSLDDEATSTLAGLGYHIISIDVDTFDYGLQNNIPAAVANLEAGLDAGGRMVLAHDVHQQTVQSLLPAMIQSIQARGLTAVTVGECLGDPAANWYAGPRGSTNSVTSTSTSTSTTSTSTSTTSTASTTTTTATSTSTSTSTTTTRPTTTATSTSTTTTTRPTTTATSTTTTTTRPTTTATSTTTTTTRPTTTATSTSTSTRPPTSATTLPNSPDWTCGSSVGYRCPSNNCCSQWGWCGTGSDYCGTGCQRAYGRCR